MTISVYVVLGLAILGVLDALYLAWHRYKEYKAKAHQPMVCPLGFNCEAVIESKYGKTFFGVGNEVWGIIFYAILIVLSVLYLSTGQSNFLAIAYLISIPAVIVSAILTYIQGAILKNWCTWCVASAVINLAIYVTLEGKFGLIKTFLN